MTVWRNAGPRCPSTSPPGPWRLNGQWEERGAPTAPPVLVDGQFPPWWFYGCRGCCCVWRGLPRQNRWAVMGNLSTAPFLLCRPHLRPLPPLPCWRQVLRSSMRGRADSSWTGCCQRRDLSTDVPSTPSSGRDSSMGSQPDTRSTGQCVWVWLPCFKTCLLLTCDAQKYRNKFWYCIKIWPLKWLKSIIMLPFALRVCEGTMKEHCMCEFILG